MSEHDETEVTETVTETTTTIEVDLFDEPEPKVKKAKKGVYVLQAGDTPAIVSTKLFGRGQRAVELVRANPDADWAPGTTITVP
jgi:hypothetical protein